MMILQIEVLVGFALLAFAGIAFVQEKFTVGGLLLIGTGILLAGVQAAGLFR